MKPIECREIFLSIKRYLHLAGYTNSGPVLGITTICILLPAIFYGCSEPVKTQDATETVTRLHVRGSGSDTGCPVDVLVFNNDRHESLNTYQRFENWNSGMLKACSSGGDMTFTILANAQRERYDWAEIRSRSHLSNLMVCLENESRIHPAMTGECRGHAGEDVSVTLECISAEIHVRRLTCDFSSGSYSGCMIENPKVYLINVNAESPADGSVFRIPQRIINTGRADSGDIGKFKEADLIYQELESPIGSDGTERDIRLICYPNNVSEESPGSPYTRLVIEGTVKGKTYFWSFNIGDNDGKPEIVRSCRYSYDIHITRPGTSDPDIPIEPAEGEIFMEIERWKEKDEYGVSF